MFESDFKDFMVNETMVKKEGFCPMKCLKRLQRLYQHRKETVDVTFATDDDRQLEAHNKTVSVQLSKYVSLITFKIDQLDNDILIIIPS